jgi:uncharacterized protein
MTLRRSIAATPARLSPVARAAVAIVCWYQHRSDPQRPPSCRYRPTCSTYAIQSIERYGVVVGGTRAVRRLLRCRPPYGGVDEP